MRPLWWSVNFGSGNGLVPFYVTNDFRSFSIEDTGSFVINCQYYGYWWHGHANIGRRGIFLVHPKYFDLSIRGFNWYPNAQWNSKNPSFAWSLNKWWWLVWINYGISTTEEQHNNINCNLNTVKMENGVQSCKSNHSTGGVSHTELHK